MHVHVLTSFCKLLSVTWINKLLYCIVLNCKLALLESCSNAYLRMHKHEHKKKQQTHSSQSSSTRFFFVPTCSSLSFFNGLLTPDLRFFVQPNK